jgi:hypothetical protein
MLNVKEIGALILALIVISFSNSYFNLDLFLLSLLFFTIILVIYTASKKLAAYYYEAEEETRIWTFQRYGLAESYYFKTPIPIGIILAFLLPIVSFGYIPWFAVTESEIKPTPARAVKRHEILSFTEMTEWHLALISSAGPVSMFALAILAYFINQPHLAELSIYFACFNLLPLGKLDGAKIFFGSYILYAIITILAILGLLLTVII